MLKFFRYLREVKTELFKVVWPSRQETVKMTVIVIIFSLIVAVYLGGIDYFLTKLIEYIFALS